MHQRLRREAGSLLVHLDTLTQRNRTLTALFQGVMRTRLLAAARDCGRRWDRLNVKLESISGRLKVAEPHPPGKAEAHRTLLEKRCDLFQVLVCEWEEFEEETEELAVWLAQMEVGLAGVQHVTRKTCDKLRQLQVPFRQRNAQVTVKVDGPTLPLDAGVDRVPLCSLSSGACASTRVA